MIIQKCNSKPVRIREKMIMGKSLKWWFNTSLLLALSPHYVSKRIWYNTRRCISDSFSSFGYYNHSYHIIFLAGMPMSATTWMKNLLARIPGYYTRFESMPREVAINQNICDLAFKHVPKHGYSLFKTHLNPTPENLDCIFKNGVEKVLITYRDFRDVALARYHRLIEYPKSPGDPYYMDYRAMSKERAIDHNIEHVACVSVPWLRGWYEIAKKNPKQYHFTKFENLKKDVSGRVKMSQSWRFKNAA